MTPTQLAKSGSEHGQQRALFAWANMAYQFGFEAANDDRSYTEDHYASHHLFNPITQLKWLHAVHNQGHGDAIRGSTAKAEGVKAGVWDIFLPIPISGWHGLYIEMKVGSNELTSKQKEFRNDVTGYKFVVCYSWEDAKHQLCKYLGLVL